MRMRHRICGAVALALLAAAPAVRAQQPPVGGPGTGPVTAPPAASGGFASDVVPAQANTTPAQPAPTPLPAPTPAPGNERPGGTPGGAGVGSPVAAGGPKVCVREMKATTRVVYTSVCKEYCLPYGTCLWDSLFGCGDCDEGGCEKCGPVRTRSVLVKKVVPGPEVPTCALKDAPCATCAPSLPYPVTVPPQK